MKNFGAMALLLCLCGVLPASDAQTKPKKNQTPPYSDADGYRVLSAVLEPRTEESKSEPVSIFHQTVSGGTLTRLRTQCSSRIPGEFQSALEDFDKKAKVKQGLQRQFTIQNEYEFVQTRVGVRSGIYSVSAVGFDEHKARAIVLVQYLVSGSGILGGYKMLYLLRRTETGWQQAADAPKCGLIF